MSNFKDKLEESNKYIHKIHKDLCIMRDNDTSPLGKYWRDWSKSKGQLDK